MALSETAIQGKLRSAPGWELAKKSIQKRFAFDNFKQALAFVNQVGDLAEKADHHPDITVNYNKVTLTLSTHSAGGLTDKDFDLAGQIEKIGKAEQPANKETSDE